MLSDFVLHPSTKVPPDPVQMHSPSAHVRVVDSLETWRDGDPVFGIYGYKLVSRWVEVVVDEPLKDGVVFG